MKKVIITLEKLPGDGGYLPNTHTTYAVNANGKKIGELIHRHSKDTYHVNWSDDMGMLDAEHFRLRPGYFDKYMIEEMFSEEFSKLFNAIL